MFVLLLSLSHVVTSIFTQKYLLMNFRYSLMKRYSLFTK